MSRQGKRAEAEPSTDRGGPLYLTTLFLAAVCVGGAPLLPSTRAEPNGVVSLSLIGLLCGLAWLLHMIVQRRQGGAAPMWGTTVGWPLMLFLLLMGLSVLVTSHQRPGIVALIEWGGAVALCLVLTQLLHDRSAQRFIPALLIASLLVVALHGLHQKFIDLPAAREIFEKDPKAVARRLGLSTNVIGDLRGRMGGGTPDRVFSTFLQPTTLSGYFALVFPMAVAWVVGVWRRVRGGRRAAVAAGGLGLLVAVLWCFVEARSKGGLLALATALGVVMLWGVWRVVDRVGRSASLRRKRLMFACTILALLLVGGGLFAGGIASGKLPPWRDFMGSFVVRAGYWRAGVLMARDHPVLGIGPDNFQDAYTTYKRAEDQDAKRTHNDYVQVAAEMGLAALAAYLWVWVAFLRRLLKGEPRAADGESPAPRRYVLYAGLLAGVIIFVLELRFGDTFASSEGIWYFLWPAILWACWSGAFVFVYALTDVVPARALRIGVVAGVAAMLVHTVVDFNMQVAGYRTTTLVLLAVGVALVTGKQRKSSWPMGALVCAAFVCAGIQIVAWGQFARSAGRAYELYERATYIRGGVIEGSAEEQIGLLDQAAALDPLNAEYPGALADMYALLVSRDRAGAMRREHAEHALAYAQDAARLNPMRAFCRTRVARAHVILSGLSQSRVGAKGELEKALEAYLEAKRLYPSSPITTADVAETYDALGRQEEAVSLYREALDLNGRQYSHMQGVLPVERRRRITSRLKAWDAL